ncbi:MAG: 16S rRNA (guanine(527)-N(7))-methyltransferase RsmG [Oscillospiraceae bacterium]|jgi:16S rRNA (guanine(527)-N(7))-methyltransferase RsmG|nr:16S rRNA (guanine(527)-N(7))-methyltransferase RsmG [Oscillospiraceae bacterium]
MLYPVELIEKYCGDYVNADMLPKFQRYGELLAEWNEKINLTAIKEPKEVVIKHFIDSLALLRYVELPENSRLIDVGTGAGFPGVPIKIVRPDVNLTLLDSLNKRISFLQALTQELGAEAQCLHARAEEGGRLPKLRESFDIATARAVANLRELSEYCLPFVKIGGAFAVMKGSEIEEELAAAQSAIKLLGGSVESVNLLELPDSSKRSIIIIRKIGKTPEKYPRQSAKIKKNPI